MRDGLAHRRRDGDLRCRPRPPRRAHAPLEDSPLPELDRGAAPPTPIFPSAGDLAYTLGVVTQFFALRDQIVSNNGYTMAMGEDLGIVGSEIVPLAPTNVTPSLKASVSMGNTVNLTGSMQGMDALRVEYAPKGGVFSTVAFLTKTPGGFLITPTNPSGAETGFVRAVFIKKNAEFGNFSPNYPVTVS